MAKYFLNRNPHGSHFKIIEFVGKNKKVLEVGCSSGYLSKYLSKNGNSVVGIEIDKSSAEHAQNFCKMVMIGDIETITSIPYAENYFDVIIFADILEHLKNPLESITKLKPYLNNDGIMICSIPNVAHIWLRLNLLLGKWDYQNTGFLDISHLRFFTLKTAKKLVRKSGFKIEMIDVSVTNPMVKILGNRLAYLLTKSFKTLLASQFIIISKKDLV